MISGSLPAHARRVFEDGFAISASCPEMRCSPLRVPERPEKARRGLPWIVAFTPPALPQGLVLTGKAYVVAIPVAVLDRTGQPLDEDRIRDWTRRTLFLLEERV